ncbi:MAG TPA: hypothetical protein VE783_00150 [Candidatus Limnocylindrales bacterium]|nr:hypothetical protein [Candidatus Limnocylindrales bacterium]
MAQIKKMSAEQMQTMIQECAGKLGRTPTMKELLKMTGYRISKTLVARRFGSYLMALKACGLQSEWRNSTVTDVELFLSWAAAARELGALPTVMQYQALRNRSQRPILKLVKKWADVPNKMMAIMQEQNLAAEWEDVARMIEQRELEKPEAAGQRARRAARADGSSGEERTPRDTRVANAGAAGAEVMPEVRPAGEMRCDPWREALVEPPELIDGQPVFGDPIGHPAMAFAPTNEATLAILFGAMAVQLGFVILRAQQPCPDVLALRKMKGGWQLQKIELEIESINFLRHMHDKRDADLIVCWKHNWKDCPVPVLELSQFF